MINNVSEFEKEELSFINGLYVGQLTDEGLELFSRSIDAGVARRSYDGINVFLGLAKVEVLRWALERI